MIKILIYSENLENIKNISKYVKAKGVTSQINTVSVNQNECEEYYNHGIDRVYNYTNPELNQFDLNQYKAILHSAVSQSESSIILLGTTRKDTELASSLAASLNAGCITGCYEVNFTDDKLEIKKYMYGGSIVSTQVLQGAVKVATVIPGPSTDDPIPSTIKEHVELDADIPSPRVKVIEQIEKKKAASTLKDAKVIVSVGRGLRKEEDVKLLTDLAEKLDASIGCTRPMAADQHWFDEWIGISGEKVAPELYVACGISGTIQHLSGIRDSKIIISINNDPNASIHNVSDYSIVADLYKILPALTKALEK